MTIEQDYIDLFTHKKKGHMTKYIHMYRPEIYDAVILQESFYPFPMERDILIKKVDQIIDNLSGIKEVIEIGPGSEIPITEKTIPLLNSLQHYFCLEAYKAMDINILYAQQACKIVQEYFTHIKTEAIEIDFLSKKQFNDIVIGFQNGKRKLLYGLGQPIFANNTDEDIQEFLNNISSILTEQDYILCGIDTNRDKKRLEKAYNTNLFYELLLNIMYYLRNYMNLVEFNPKGFELVYKWDPIQNSVNLFLKPTYQQEIKIKDQRIILATDQEYHITSSRKPDINQIESVLSQASLKMKDVISLDNRTNNKYLIIIIQKININNN